MLDRRFKWEGNGSVLGRGFKRESKGSYSVLGRRYKCLVLKGKEKLAC